MNEPMTATQLLLLGASQSASEAQLLCQRLTASLAAICRITQEISELASVNPDEMNQAQEAAQTGISIENARLEIQGYVHAMLMTDPIGKALLPGLEACESLRVPFERRAEILRAEAAREFQRQAAESAQDAQEEAQAADMVRVLTRAGYVVAKRKQKEAA